MCKVDPNNVVILRYVGGMLLLCVIIAIISGAAYCKRIIRRADEPIGYWSTVSIYFLLGVMLIIGTFVCRT